MPCDVKAADGAVRLDSPPRRVLGVVQVGRDGPGVGGGSAHCACCEQSSPCGNEQHAGEWGSDDDEEESGATTQLALSLSHCEPLLFFCAVLVR